MNIFTTLSQRFLNTFADYTMLRDVGARIADVEQLIATTAQDKMLLSRLTKDPTTRMALQTQLLEQFINYRNDLNRYEPLKCHYLVIAMIDTLSYDILAINPRTNNTFDIVIDSRFPASIKANQIVNAFRESTNLDIYVSKILFDGLFYGQYWVEYVKNKSGQIVGLKDSYQPGSIFTVGLEGVDCRPMYYKLSAGTVNKIAVLDNDSIICLDMQNDRYRYSMSSMQVSLQSRDATIAQTGTLGRPFCFEIYDKLVALEMLEQLWLASITASLQRNSLVSVQAPDGLDLEQIKEFVNYYEKLINNNGEDNGIFDIERIRLFAAEATKLRVVPNQTQRGTITQSLSNSAADPSNALPDSIDKMRAQIMDIKGIPADFVFSGRDDSKVGGALRRYARYARIVKAGQAALQRFLVRIIHDVLESNGYDVPLDLINVTQYCAINTSELDRLEYADAAADVISKVFDTIMTVTDHEAIKPYVDGKERAKYIETLLDSLAGASQIINVKDDNDKKVS